MRVNKTLHIQRIRVKNKVSLFFASFLGELVFWVACVWFNACDSKWF